jgi:hypothetical protein
MWFWHKPKTIQGITLRDLNADLRDITVDLRDPPPAPRPPKPLLSSQAFADDIVPQIERRWDAHCFCHSEQFLKLIAFDFRDYGIGPASLADTYWIISRIILKRFEALGPWRQDSDGGRRQFGCPQCGTQFEVWSEEYSIAMSVLSAKPLVPLQHAETGRYAASFYYFTGQEHELARIADYRPADSIAQYLNDLTGSP